MDSDDQERLRAWLSEAVIQAILQDVGGLNLEQTQAAQRAVNGVIAALRLQLQGNMRVLAALDKRETELNGGGAEC